MLTAKEYEQIEWAIKAMSGHSVNDSKMVYVSNVLGLLQRYTKEANDD